MLMLWFLTTLKEIRQQYAALSTVPMSKSKSDGVMDRTQTWIMWRVTLCTKEALFRKLRLQCPPPPPNTANSGEKPVVLGVTYDLRIALLGFENGGSTVLLSCNIENICQLSTKSHYHCSSVT